MFFLIYPRYIIVLLFFFKFIYKIEWNFTLPAYCILFYTLKWRVRGDTINVSFSQLGSFTSQILSHVFVCHRPLSSLSFQGNTTFEYALNETLYQCDKILLKYRMFYVSLIYSPLRLLKQKSKNNLHIPGHRFTTALSLFHVLENIHHGWRTMAISYFLIIYILYYHRDCCISPDMSTPYS